MKISDLGEEGIIQLFKTQFNAEEPLVGIGDDCAVIPLGDKEEQAWLVTTDALVEGVHFLKSTITFHDLGYKAAMVNLSDIAAMGGHPRYAFLSIGIPQTLNKANLESFIAGLHEAFLQTGVLLLGGDTVHSRSDLFINLTLIGQQKLKHIKKRNQARPGDLLCVDSTLGDSAAGLDLLLRQNSTDWPELVAAHVRPRAHIEEGQWLAEKTAVHAMMDLSDGLAIDLGRLLRESKCGCWINVEEIPLSETLRAWCAKEKKNPYEIAISGGEEYCLLFTLSPESYEEIRTAFVKQFGRPFWKIGEITEKQNEIDYKLNGKVIDLELHPFHHF